MKNCLILAAALILSFALAACDAKERCESNDQQYCAEGVLYWVDSCGVLEDIIETCQCGCAASHDACEQCTCIPECQGLCCGDDGCGGDCPDTCSQTGQACNPVSCTCEGVCQPQTCQELAKQCGRWADGCGDYAECGECPPDRFCNPEGQCEFSCQPQTCAELGRECGSWDNGCGQTIHCDSCLPSEICTPDGICQEPGCPDGFTRCGDECVDTAWDSAHCGGCYQPCVGNRSCQDSACQDLPEECPPEGCPFGSYCDLNLNQCVPGCLDDEGCLTGYICEGRTCIPGCRHDIECQAGQICENQECQVGCRQDQDCANGQICENLLCVSGCRTDQDCSPGMECLNLSCVVCAWDVDSDGHYSIGSCLHPADDCDDQDPEIYTGRPEACDGKDNDCDGATDEGVQTTYYQDLDSDGWGSSVTTLACSQPPGYVGQGGDCDDLDDEMAPDLFEVCDGKDNDCYGGVDDDLYPPLCAVQTGVCDGSVKSCGGAAGWLYCTAEDYGEFYETVESLCDDLDNDCDGLTDSLSRDCSIAHHGICAQGIESCSAGQWAGCPAPEDETCDGIDNNCDSNTDEGLTPPFCPLNEGECRSAYLLRDCLGEEGWEPCTPDMYSYHYEEVEISCDNRDNDCDGVTDSLTIPCSDAHHGICSIGSETCTAGNWVGCPGPEDEQCGDGLDNNCDGLADEPGSYSGPTVDIALGDLPHITATADGFVAAWRTTDGSQVAMQKLDALGSPLGSPTLITGARPILVLDLASFEGGICLAWAEDRPEQVYGPTATYAQVFDFDLNGVGQPQWLPYPAATNWNQSTEIRVGTRDGGTGVVIGERIFTDVPGYGSHMRFVLFPSASPSSTEFEFDSHGSTSQGPQPLISIADLPDGFALAWAPPDDLNNGGYVSVYTSDGTLVWGPKNTFSSNGRSQSVTYDGVRLISIHHWHAYRTRTFDLVTGNPSSIEAYASDLYWPRAADAAYLDPYSIQLATTEGELYTVRFDSQAAMVGRPALVVARADGECYGTSARMAVGTELIGLLYTDQGQVSFVGLCR